MAELGSEIFFAGIAELNRMVRAKQATALELARAFGRRLETLGPRYNALALPSPSGPSARRKPWMPRSSAAGCAARCKASRMAPRIC
jgi:Asp-tRNA(Asn)/Glu-tRNA(Gln) amidotransferase A subunit family amidase